MKNIYPCTIINDRYTGAYSGGIWTAWNLDFLDLPEAIDLDDVSCMDFWCDFDRNLVGFGNTPQEAYEDLSGKLND